MMKKIKKLVAIALAAVMVMALGSMAMAVEATGTSSDTGTITISGLEDGVTVTAYQIVKANYDGDNFLGYEQTVIGGDFTIDQYGNYDESKLTEANLAALYDNVGDAYKTATSVDGTATFEGMEVGSYLFVVTGSESTVYGMVIASVYYAAEDGSWVTEETPVDVQGENAWVKASEPTITKEEVGGSIADDGWSHGGSADVGDELTYHITVANIPTYEGQYPVFNVTDKIASELTITDDEFNDLTVKIGDVTLVKGTDYTATKTDDGFVIDFVVDGKYTLNDYAGLTLVIEFGATVTAETDDDLAADDVDHENDATLDYATTSYVYGMDVEKEDSDHDYTFNVKIQKIDATEDKNPLADATFALYTDEACENAYTQNGAAITATSNDDGYFEFAGLEEGTYYMKETKAPAGYALNTNLYKVDISVTYNEDGTLATGYTITVTDVTNNTVVGSAIVTSTNAQIVNTKTGTLPSTGGRGTLIFTIIGCAIVVCAVVGVVATRRRRAA